MKQNTKVFFAVSIAALFAISVVSVMTLQEADASKNHWKFKKKPDFTAELEVKTAAPEGAAATAEFWLDKKGKALKYKISIENMDISGGATSTTDDDVTKLHLHATQPDGPHVLNVYKAPGEDDDDLVVKPTKGTIEGIWDDSDENLTYDDHHNYSQTFTSQLETLCDDGLFTMIHGVGGGPALKGDIEATKQGDKACKKLGY